MPKLTQYPTEDAEQAALFRWAERAACTMPELRLLYAVPNGGYRHVTTAVNLKRTGVKAGVPDICLPVARGGCHALYIELKRVKGGKVSEAQREWQAALNAQGNMAVVCYGWEDARKVIENYLHYSGPDMKGGYNA